MSTARPRLKGKVIAVLKTGRTTAVNGATWEECVFTVEIAHFSKRTPKEIIPDSLKSKKVKLVRYCLYDWHYKLGVEKTLNAEETDCLLRGQPSSTISW